MDWIGGCSGDKARLCTGRSGACVTDMGREEMEWHLLFIVYEITGLDWVTKQTGLDR